MSRRTGAAARTREIAIATTTAAALAIGVAAPTIAAERRDEGGARQQASNGDRAAEGTRAEITRTLDGSDTAHLRLVRQHEAVLYEQGAASGVLSGSMHAKLTVGSTFSGSFTIDTRDGSVTGHGSARPHGTGRYQSFSGTLYVTGGSGKYEHIHGKTQLYGTFDRRTFDVILHTRGRLSY